MPRRLFIFDRPDRFVAGVVGEPGSRAFYLQARQGGALITVGLEKTQVSALAERLGELLIAVGEAGVTEAGGAAAGGTDPAPPLEEPVVELFRVGALTLAWDPEQSEVLVEARPVSEDGEYPEVSDDDPAGPDLLRVTLDPRAARRFTVAAVALVAAGRPACPFCGQPLDPTGHFCLRMNGHRT
jgi:uncharacterized repeat protein (TIGR03847 family)